MLSVTELQIKSYEQIELWCQLFQDISGSCRCVDDTESQTVENDVNFNEQLMNYELEECLVMDMLDKVIHYFACVHLSDVLSKYKDVKISKQKSTSLRHALIAGVTEKDMNPNKVDFPCGICGNAYIEIESIKDPQFEDQSIGCDKWFHFICVNITGNEANVQAGFDLPYFCPTCQEPNSTIDGNTPSISGKGKGNGKGKSSAKKKLVQYPVQTHIVPLHLLQHHYMYSKVIEALLCGEVLELANPKLTKIINSIECTV